MKKLLKLLVFGLLSLVFGLLSLVSGLNSALAADSIRMVSRLYEDGHHATGEMGEIVDMETVKNFLYVSWRDLDGDQYLEVWNVRNSESPQYVTSYSFGNSHEDEAEVLPTAFLRAPKRMKAFDGYLVLWSEFKMQTYNVLEDGSLDLVYSSSIRDELNRNLALTSYGGTFASSQRTMLDNGDVLDLIDAGWIMSEIDDVIQREVFLNMSDPTAPHIMAAPRSEPGLKMLQSRYPIAGTYNGLPATLNLDTDAFQLEFESFELQTDTHFNDFWLSKVWEIFNSELIGMSLDEIYTGVVNDLNLQDLQNRLIEAFKSDLGFNDALTIRDIILEKYDGSLELTSILSDYDIGLDDSAQVALEKIIEKNISAEFDQRVSGIVYAELLEAWRDKVFSFDNRTIADLKNSILNSLSVEIESVGVKEYFVRFVVSPLLNNPDYMDMRLRDLVASISGSPAGRAADFGLRAFNIAMPFDFLWFDAPACFDIPDSSRGFLELALYDHGIGLDPDGLAFWELIKMSQYFMDNDLFRNYDLDVADKLEALNVSLVDNFFQSIFGFIDADIQNGLNIDTFIQKYAESLSVKKIVKLSIKEVVKEILDQAELRHDISVRELFRGMGLYVDRLDVPAGESVALVSDLISELNVYHISLIRVNELLDNAKIITLSPMRIVFKDILIGMGEEIFGLRSLDLNFKFAIKTYVLSHLSAGKPFEDFLSDIMNRVLTTRAAHGFVSGWLTNAIRAAKGDCIAQWQTAINAASLIAHAIPPFEPIALDLDAAQIALSGAYRAAVNFVVSELVNSMASGIIRDASGSYKSWYSRLERNVEVFDMGRLASFRPALMESFVWKDKIYVVLRNVGGLGPHPIDAESGQVSLLEFDPSDPAGSVEEYDLGGWQTVNSVIQEDKYILIGGSVNVDGNYESNLMVIDVENHPDNPMQFTGDAALFLIVPEDAAVIDNGAALAVKGADSRVTIVDLPEQDSLSLNNMNSMLVDPNDNSGAGIGVVGAGAGAGASSSGGGCSIKNDNGSESIAMILILVIGVGFMLIIRCKSI